MPPSTNKVAAAVNSRLCWPTCRRQKAWTSSAARRIDATGDDVPHGKPDPRIVAVALRKLGVSSFEAVMIGDTPYDAEAASGAGTAAAGVLTGGFSADALSGAGWFAVAGEISGLLVSLEEASPRTGA